MGALARAGQPPAVSPEEVLGLLEAVRRNGEGRWMARCPAHGDRSASLSVRLGDDGRTLLHCFAGCSFGEVVEALHLEPQQLFPPTEAPWRPSAPRPDPLSEARALLSRLQAMHAPVAPERLHQELTLVGRLVLGGTAAFRELPPEFSGASLRVFPLRIMVLAMAELVRQGTPRRWFSPRALDLEIREAARVWGTPGSVPAVHQWARLAVREARQ